MAKWIARATWAANNCDEAPYRDTEASQWRADVSRKEAKAMKAAAAAELALSTPAGEHPNLRGHNPVKVLQFSGIRSGWRCTICRNMSSSKKLLASRKCMGCPLIKRSTIVADDDEGPPLQQVQMHRRMQSGTVLWCSRCGVYADKKAKGLARTCNGTPPRHRNRGGMEGQLRKLRNGIHPKTGASLPMAVVLDLDPKLIAERKDEHKVMPEGFYTYVAAEPPPLIPSDSAAAARRWGELRARIRGKELLMRASSKVRILKTSITCKGKYRIMAKGAACHGQACCEGA